MKSSSVLRPTIQPELSPGAAAYVQQHPQAAERIAAHALEAAARSAKAQTNRSSSGKKEDRRLVSSFETSSRLPLALRRFVVPATTDPTHLSISEAAKRLGVTRATVYAWIDNHQLLAFRVTENAWGIPAEQILGPRKIVPGIDRVLEVIPQPGLAWDFLTEALPFFVGEAARPIDMLKRGAVDAVVDAAQAYGEAFS